MGPECTQTAPGPGWTRPCRRAVLGCFSVLSLVSCGWSPAAGHPAAPSPSFHPDLDATALEQGSPGRERANRMLLWTEMPGRLSQSRMSWCQDASCRQARGSLALGPCPDTLPPFPAPPSLTLGEHRKGVSEPENRLCVPSGCSPTGAGTGRGWGRHRARLSPSPSSDTPATGSWCL